MMDVKIRVYTKTTPNVGLVRVARVFFEPDDANQVIDRLGRQFYVLVDGDKLVGSKPMVQDEHNVGVMYRENVKAIRPYAYIELNSLKAEGLEEWADTDGDNPVAAKAEWFAGDLRIYKPTCLFHKPVIEVSSGPICGDELKSVAEQFSLENEYSLEELIDSLKTAAGALNEMISRLDGVGFKVDVGQDARGHPVTLHLSRQIHDTELK